MFEECKWSAQGIYFDDFENPRKLTAETEVSHEKDFWRLGGFMEVMFDKPVRFENDYKIFYKAGTDTIPWESHNPAFGILKGKFSVAGDLITSSYTSENGAVKGWEVLKQIEEYKYFNAGTTFLNNKKLSSWSVTITKK